MPEPRRSGIGRHSSGAVADPSTPGTTGRSHRAGRWKAGVREGSALISGRESRFRMHGNDAGGASGPGRREPFPDVSEDRHGRPRDAV